MVMVSLWHSRLASACTGENNNSSNTAAFEERQRRMKGDEQAQPISLPKVVNRRVPRTRLSASRPPKEALRAI